MTVMFFGEPWDAAFLAGAVQRAVPAGEMCFRCGEEVLPLDQGLLTNAGPAHRECDLRAAVGDLAHLQNRCGCATGGDERTPTFRDEALAVLAWTEMFGPLPVTRSRPGRPARPAASTTPAGDRDPAAGERA